MNKIKRLLILIVLILLCVGYSCTQVNTYGIKLGAVSSKLKFNYTDLPNLDTYYRWGTNIGFFMEMIDLGSVGITGSVDYVQKGVGFRAMETTPALPEGTGRSFSFADEVDYISLNVLLELKENVGFGKIYLLVGPRLDILLRTLPNWGIYSSFRDGSYGITVGGGFTVSNIAARGMGLEIQYSPNLGKEYSSDKLNITGTSVQILLVLEL